MNVIAGQMVFARWKDGYYYPAIVDEASEQDAKVSYLDGDQGRASREHVVELEEALQTMQLQGN